MGGCVETSDRDPQATMADEEMLDSALDLMRRLPPQNIEEDLDGLIQLAPDLCEDLLAAVDQPLKIAKDTESGRDYLLCDYNRDGDSYRSPFTNKYYPPLEDGAVPSPELRKMEIQANAAFDTYREMYYDGGVSSAYLWDVDDGFAGCILIKKPGAGSKKMKGCWDSIHVVEVINQGAEAQYQLTSTVMLWMQTNKESSGSMNLGGSMTRQDEKTLKVNSVTPHLANIGKMIEDLEFKMRAELQEIYFGKTAAIVNDTRSINGVQNAQQKKNLQMDIASALAGRRK